MREVNDTVVSNLHNTFQTLKRFASITRIAILSHRAIEFLFKIRSLYYVMYKCNKATFIVSFERIWLRFAFLFALALMKQMPASWWSHTDQSYPLFLAIINCESFCYCCNYFRTLCFNTDWSQSWSDLGWAVLWSTCLLSTRTWQWVFSPSDGFFTEHCVTSTFGGNSSDCSKPSSCFRAPGEYC